ncbi:hypothetical protein IFM89_002791 [Coptis chinensis]|uniref:Uncharacterized protein n=1 Tax=Coptis chinensis TaxID=261450 RepID=A0A835HSN6_9MAGN|nr:hypothetical protein IFM89_002791 [Coptis chinensis]
MNKMNIPAPFRMALPTPPLPTSLPAPPPLPPALVAKPHLADLSSDESELESAEEGDEDEDKSGLVDAPSKSKCGRKRCRREAIVGPAVNKDVAHEDVGLKPATLAPKEMPMIKKNNPVLQIKLAAKPIHNEDKYDADNMNESGEPGKEGMELKPFATTKDIERGKLPPEEILSLPMFKNYSAGSSATVLYIKNVAKDMITDDFYFIFGGGGEFLPRFLTHHMLQNLVNGYVFKGKPMIIQFGRNPGAARAN